MFFQKFGRRLGKQKISKNFLTSKTQNVLLYSYFQRLQTAWLRLSLNFLRKISAIYGFSTFCGLRVKQQKFKWLYKTAFEIDECQGINNSPISSKLIGESKPIPYVCLFQDVFCISATYSELVR